MSPGQKLSAFVIALSITVFVPAHAETFRVTIDKLDFLPREISAKVGDTVEWINNDVFAHTATVSGDWDVMIGSKKSESIILTKVGDVEYYCRFHPNMKGHIAVGQK